MEDRKDKQDAQRILLIKETIASAEKSLQTAKSILAQLESKYVPQKKTYGVAEGGKIVEGTFDGQLMIGMDGRQYPVPANYASKSKLVEGDMLKLVITDDGNFIYKQIGPFKRKRLLGILKESTEEGGYIVEAEGKNYRVLLAAVTYHHASVGDEIALVVADNEEALWGAIENVTKKGDGTAVGVQGERDNVDSVETLQQNELLKGEEEEDGTEEDIEENDVGKTDEGDQKNTKKKREKVKIMADESDQTIPSEGDSVQENNTDVEDVDEELTPDLEEMEKELKKQVAPK